MNTMTTAKTVGELAAENPAAARVFEKLGIDYCCHGACSLEEACHAAALPVEVAQDALELAFATARATSPDHNWTAEPLADLIAHIRNTHHEYTRSESERLSPLFAKVCAAHAANHPELNPMRETFAALAHELGMHLMKEEMVLFPYIVRMEEAVVEKSPLPPAPFGSVRNPVAMMVNEHDGAGEALRALRSASHDYAVPPDACASYRSLYQGLAALEADLHQHIHLENNILFPRAVAMEQSRTT